jgi:hypothetical protein
MLNGGHTLITGADVLEMLLPNGGWVIAGDEYEGIQFLECEPITKAQYEAGFAKYDAWKAEQASKVTANKATLLAKLGITADEAKLLLS